MTARAFRAFAYHIPVPRVRGLWKIRLETGTMVYREFHITDCFSNYDCVAERGKNG